MQRGRHDEIGAERGHALQIDVLESADHRLKALFHFLLTGRRDAGQRSSVKRIESCDDFVTAFIVAEFSSEFK